ncbi:hypothetical protein MPSEU_000276800 [Mayamaea pseudoterrestris]|nr:hypothetical protein MPSEU_000276800 [Mayamaea pseudoterrestris]
MISPNRKQLLDRRALRNRKTLSVGPPIFLLVFVGSIGLVWLLALTMISLFDNQSFKSKQDLYSASPHSFTDAAIDLWPSDRQSTTLLDMLVSCLPEHDNDEICRQRRIPGSTIQQIALARPPGRLGIVMQHFVKQVIERHSLTDDEVKLVPVTHVERDHKFTKIVRFAVLPILLEAVDLALETTDSSFTTKEISISDIEATVRLLIHWHCQLSEIASDTAFLTLSAKKVLSRPTESVKEIANFVGFGVEKKEDWMTGKAVDDRAAKALDRIDECSEFISKLQQQTPKQDLQALFNKIIHDTIAKEECGNMEMDAMLHKSRVPRIARHMLGPDSDTVCDEYPAIAYCTSKLVI